MKSLNLYIIEKLKIDKDSGVIKTVQDRFKILKNFIDGKLGCRDCSLKEKSNNQKLTTEEFIKRAVKIHGNLYDYSESNYIDTKTPVKIKDNETGDIFWQKPEVFLICQNLKLKLIKFLKF